MSVDAACERLLGMLPRLTPRAHPLGEARGLVLGADVVAARDLPGFDNSAMDGFAVRAADTAGASSGAPVQLRVVGEVAAGARGNATVEAGTAVRIMTGAPLPAGADAIVEVERTTSADGASVLVQLAVAPGRSVRRAGDDIRRGDVALTTGTVLGAAQVALLAALGEVNPVCVPRPQVAVVATGDELVDPAETPGPGQVTDIVGTALPAAVREAGGVPVTVTRAADTEADVRRALGDAAADADLVISVGGVSMGEYDFVRRVIERDGALEFWRVAMRPGKPLAVGTFAGRTVVGLPGNPVSALVGFEVYVLPAILAMSGRPSWRRPRASARLLADLDAPEGLRNFVRAHAERGEDGALSAQPLAGQGSHQLRSLAAANALIDVPEDVTSMRVGADVDVLLLEQCPGPAW